MGKTPGTGSAIVRRWSKVVWIASLFPISGYSRNYLPCTPLPRRCRGRGGRSRVTVPFQRFERNKPCADFRVQLGGKVPVTAGLGIAARDGAKRRRTTNARPVQLRFVRSKGGDHVLGQIGCGRCAHRACSHPKHGTNVVSRRRSRLIGTSQRSPHLFGPDPGPWVPACAAARLHGAAARATVRPPVATVQSTNP